MNWILIGDILHTIGVSTLVVLVVIFALDNNKLRIINTETASAHGRCELIVDRATRIMTRQQRWQFHKRIEDLNIGDRNE